MIAQILPLIDVGGLWHQTYFVGLTLTIWWWLVFSNRARNTAESLITRTFFAYAYTWCLWLTYWPSIHFGPYTPNYGHTAGQVAIEILFIALAGYAIKGKLRTIAPFVVAFELFQVWTGGVGLLKTPSFDIAFTAAMIPFLEWPMILAILVTVVCNHSRTALLVCGMMLMPWLQRLSWPRFIGASAALALLARVIATYHSPLGLTGGNGREDVLVKAFSFWAAEPRYWFFGVGPGSYLITGAALHGFTGQFLLDLHSSWLTVLWDFGLVGLIWVGLIWIEAMRGTMRLRTRAALWGAAALGLTYHPMGFFPSALLISAIVQRAFNERFSRASLLATGLNRYWLSAKLQTFASRIRFGVVLLRVHPYSQQLQVGLLRYRQLREQAQSGLRRYLKR